MRKSVLKMLSYILGVAITINSVPMRSNAKGLTKEEKILIGAGFGVSALLVGGAVLYWIFGKHGGTNRNGVLKDVELTNIDSASLEYNLREWIHTPGKDTNNRKALMAAINIYSEKIVKRRYDQIQGSLPKCFSEEREHICTSVVCSIMSFLAKVDAGCELYYSGNIKDMADVLTEILRSSPENLSPEIKEELEVMKKGTWDDSVLKHLDQVKDFEFPHQCYSPVELIGIKMSYCMGYKVGSDNRKAFEAALNIYSLATCRKMYEQLINPIKKQQVGDEAPMSNFCKVVCFNDSVGGEQHECIKNICCALSNVCEDCREQAVRTISEVIFMVQQTPPERLSESMRHELEIFEKGEKPLIM